MARGDTKPGRPWLLLVAFATVYLVWGSTYLGIRLAIATIPPLLMAGARFALGGLALLVWARVTGRRWTPIRWRPLLVMSALMLLGGNGGVTYAEQHVPSAYAALLVATEPLWLVILSSFGGQSPRPGRREVAGLILGFAGVLILVWPASAAAAGPTPELHAGAAALVLLGALCWAAGSIYGLSAPLPADAIVSNALIMLLGGAMLLTAGVLHGEAAQLHLHAVSAQSALALAYLTLFGSIAAFSAYTYLLGHTTPARASTYAYVNPAIAVLLGWSLGGEHIGAHAILAMVVILGAVIWIGVAGARRPPRSLRSLAGERAAVETAPC